MSYEVDFHSNNKTPSRLIPEGLENGDSYAVIDITEERDPNNIMTGYKFYDFVVGGLRETILVAKWHYPTQSYQETNGWGYVKH